MCPLLNLCSFPTPHNKRGDFNANGSRMGLALGSYWRHFGSAPNLTTFERSSPASARVRLVGPLWLRPQHCSRSSGGCDKQRRTPPLS